MVYDLIHVFSVSVMPLTYFVYDVVMVFVCDLWVDEMWHKVGENVQVEVGEIVMVHHVQMHQWKRRWMGQE